MTHDDRDCSYPWHSRARVCRVKTERAVEIDALRVRECCTINVKLEERKRGVGKREWGIVDVSVARPSHVETLHASWLQKLPAPFLSTPCACVRYFPE